MEEKQSNISCGTPAIIACKHFSVEERFQPSERIRRQFSKRTQSSIEKSFYLLDKDTIFQEMYKFFLKMIQKPIDLWKIIHNMNINMALSNNSLNPQSSLSLSDNHQKVSCSGFNDSSKRILHTVNRISDTNNNSNETKIKGEFQNRQNARECSILINQQENFPKAAKKVIKKNIKKISIMGGVQNEQLSSSQWQSSFLSLQSDDCFPQLPSKTLSLEVVKDIYQLPQPFLINLSVCLMLKYIYYTNSKLGRDNVIWIISIATIIAYKIYYDQPVNGLIRSFANILNIKPNEVILMQRMFLNEINHEVIVTNEQYHTVLYSIIHNSS